MKRIIKKLVALSQVHLKLINRIRTMSNLLYNGQEINQRADGYVNATQMAKANGKLVANYLQLSSTNAYIEALSHDIGIPISQLLIVKKGGLSEQGTWMHPLVAIAFAQWISPEFHVWCNMHIKTLMETGTTTIVEPEPTPVKELPQTRAVEYMALMQWLGFEDDMTMKQLIRDKAEEELYQATGRVKPTALPEPKHKEFTIVKVRARELGYSDKEIGDGSMLGKFVVKHIKPAYEQRVGKYSVKHYEVNDELDTCIKTYFGLKRAIA